MSNARTLANTINSSSQIVVPSGGVNFGTSTDGTGTVTGGILDDYETGSFTPTFANFTIGNDGTVFGSYIKVGKIVHLWYGFTFGSDSAINGSITSSGTAPFASKARGGTVNCYTPVMGVIWDNGSGWSKIFSQMSDGTASLGYILRPDSTSVTSTSPITWATNDSLMLQMTYEID